jgi:hypothetical protein
MKMRPLPLGKPRSFAQTPDGQLILRMTSPSGERMATPIRAMKIRDAFVPPRWLRPK